ncbi:MAG: response regulator [Acidobacteria bacterium]|nr:response regulator [Acidobacteriota bacterium]
MAAPTILAMAIQGEHDVVTARQRAREIAALLGFDGQDQARIATAVSEIARNTLVHGRGGSAEFAVDTVAGQLRVRLADHGTGPADLAAVLRGQRRTGYGLQAARRLMDDFSVAPAPGGGTLVELGKALPEAAPDERQLAHMAARLARGGTQDPFAEIRQQNRELLRTLAELTTRQEELLRLNRELEETNRGVVALYAELDDKAEWLRRASEVKSRFFSSMSHEFRTPVNAITSLARLLLDRADGELSVEQERQVQMIQRSAQDLRELIDDLLDISRLEAGKLVVRAAPFEVAELFGGLRGMLRALLVQRTSVALVFDEPEGIPPLVTDEGKVSQILRNLISNALKFTPRGEVRVGARLEGDAVVFSVADTGIGIAPADQERIFEEFVQVESELQGQHKGSGLGLPLSRRLAEMLGGSLEVGSVPGEGSVFRATIPRQYTGAGEVALGPEPRRLDPVRTPVLVVEDDPETMFVYQRLLRGRGYQVIPARSVREAREALGRVNPAAVVLDILLGHESGWDLLGELKSQERTSSIPVLVCTAVENEAQARALGANEFHVKPVDGPTLLAALARTCPPVVLVVDDDAAFRYVLASALGRAGFRPAVAADGREGLELARRLRPRAVLLDLVMPRLDGFAMLASLREDGELARTPVVVVTSIEPGTGQLAALGPGTPVLSKASLAGQPVDRVLVEALGAVGVLPPARTIHGESHA